MGYERFFFGFGSPQPQVDMHARSKTLSFSYNMHLFLHYLLNDSQTIRSTIHFSKPLLCVTLICGVGEYQTAFLHPWRALREGDAICRDVPNESEQLNPFTKGPSRSPLAKGTCDGHFTEGISVCDHVIFSQEILRCILKQSWGLFWLYIQT